VAFKDILKRQLDNLLSTDSNRPRVSLDEDLRQEFDLALGDAIDPGREQREADHEAASRERIRTQHGFGQFVQIDGISGQWEAVELMYFDETSASFTLVDRSSGDTAQLSAVDDGTVILDSPADQHGATIPGAFWRTATSTGIRLSSAVLTADDRRIVVNCELTAELPADEPVD
jgi:hypothetical protein